jgi:tight adherence protein B
MTPAMIRLLVLILIFASVLLAVEGVINWIRRSRSEGKMINDRLTMIGRGIDRAEIHARLRRDDSDTDDHLPGLLGDFVRKIGRMTVGSRFGLSASRLLMIITAAVLAVFMIALALVRFTGIGLSPGGIFMIAGVAFVLGFVAPLMVLAHMTERHRKKLQDQFPVALDVFVRGLRAGHPIAAALDLLTQEMPDPIGSEFGLVIDEVTYGADLRDALQGMAERWDLEDMRMFVVSLSVQSETGGNLAEILENLSKVIRDRAAMMLKVRALSSEGRMTATMLTGLPILAFTGLFLMRPSFYLDVADDPAFFPGFGGLLALYCLGFYLIRRMIDLKV